MTSPNRRAFLGRSAAAAAGWTVLAPRSGKAAPADRVNVAVMGIRGRGGGLAQGFAGLPGALVTHVVDVDSNLFGNAVEAIGRIQDHEPEAVTDFRRVLDNPDVDALVVATPDHWHAPATVFACQAGKHVYVEKPASHTLWEGRKMVEAARKYDRVVQVGTQSRSTPHYRRVIEEVLPSGRIGTVLQARAWNSQKRPDLSPQADGPAPEGVDYDLWLGPAPERPFNPNRFHYAWHWMWDYGTGDAGNDGVHDLDIARWGLGVGMPTSVACTASRMVNTTWETPDSVFASFTFADSPAVLVFEQRDWSPYVEAGYENGVIFFGTEGRVEIGRSGWRLFEGNEPVPVESEPFADRHHFEDFLDAIASARLPNADIEQGHRSAALPHLANIAFRTGRGCVTIDPETEEVVGDTEAQALTRREYRVPFVIPDRV
ncbi:Gfo/Idh/MocA family protein [Tautonia plasticadhaerens]|uniref:1,5-anhydro-D-fructose reductase n=1 Tax=Tautonia plasticadhaerens TaxID=2527974 RepID=A0A518H009_9BACT|nr:Gfo/Idh/MocA family oxidoreductase [Tautonia plasticadhaerens]QDV34171.1 1,5-anhydro-D-fructose reductase [Tautonia plasticadhaerens]